MSKMMMAKMAVGGGPPNPMNEPLVENGEEGGEGAAEPLPPNASMRQKIAAAGPKEKRKMSIVFGCSAVTFLLNMLAVMSGGFIGMIGFLLGMISVPFVIKNEIDVSTFAGKRDLFNRLRDETNRMSEINEELHDNVDEVEANVERTKRITKKLGKICDGQASNVEKLVRLVKENGEIIEAMKKNLGKSAIQTIIRVVLSGDEDRNFTIENDEVKITALKVYIELEAQGMQIRLKEFQDAIRENPRLEDLIKMLRNVLSKKKPTKGKAEKNTDYGFLVVDLDKLNKKEPESKEDFWKSYYDGDKFAPESGRKRWG